MTLPILRRGEEVNYRLFRPISLTNFSTDSRPLRRLFLYRNGSNPKQYFFRRGGTSFPQTKVSFLVTHLVLQPMVFTASETRLRRDLEESPLPRVLEGALARVLYRTEQGESLGLLLTVKLWILCMLKEFLRLQWHATRMLVVRLGLS